MLKIINSLKIDLLGFTRSKLTWIFLIISILLTGYGFYSRLPFDPGRALTSSAFVIQSGIFVTMILGYSLVRREIDHNCSEVFYTIAKGLKYKLIGKILTLLTLALLFSLVSTLTLFFFYFPETPIVFYKLALIYLFLYWVIPFFISGIIGMVVSYFIQTRLAYIILTIICILIAPLNFSIFREIGFIFKLDLVSVAHFLNLGQTDPNNTFDAVYGLPLETGRWMKQGIWLVLVLFILGISYLIRYKNKKFIYSKITILFIVTALFLAPLITKFLEEDQIIITHPAHGLQNVHRLDADYYGGLKTIDIPQNFEIKEYDIDLKSNRRLEANVRITLKLNENTSNLFFTLYHQFKIKNISINNEKLIFHRRGDSIEIDLKQSFNKNEIINLTFNYEGISSPIYFANEQAILLPSNFPWLPFGGGDNAMTMRESLVRNDLSPDHNIHYTLRYNDDNPIFTNLEKKEGEGVWKGNLPDGLTVTSGMLKQEKVNGSLVVYPISLFNSAKKIPEFIEEVEDIESNLVRDLKLQQKPNVTNKYFFLSIPGESPYFYSNQWDFSDHKIIGIDQSYNEEGVLTYSNLLVPSTLHALIRNKDIIKIQDQEIVTIFLYAYDFWYQNNYNSLKNNQEMLFDHFMNGYTDPNNKGNNVGKILEDLSIFLRNGEKDQINNFFIDWLKLLNQDKVMKMDKLNELLKEYYK
jgi:hypothetical protein